MWVLSKQVKSKITVGKMNTQEGLTRKDRLFNIYIDGVNREWKR